MVQTASVVVVPTLWRMRKIYSLGRKGGRGSPRFSAYLAEVEQHWELAAYNPMAGDAATAAVDALLGLDAESLAHSAAQAIMERCGWKEPITLAVVVATPGMWTDRLATEVRNRTVADRRPAHGEIVLWATDVQDAGTIATESVAETVRTMWTSVHGPALSLHAVIAREGLAYAFGHATTAQAPADAHVSEAIEVLGDTTAVGDIAAVLFGDETAVALGYTPLGVTERAGYRFAIARAASLISRVGVAQALRASPAAVLHQD